MSSETPPYEPSLPWRMGASFTMGVIGSLSRSFLYALNHTEAVGLDRFLEKLDERRDVEGRTRGLLTGMHCARTLSAMSDEH